MTRRPIASTVVALAALACLAPSPLPNAEDLADMAGQPTVCPEVVLRMEQSGGLAPISAALLEVPAFTLYADGSAIYRPAHGFEEADLFTPLRSTLLSAVRMDMLLAFALEEGGLADAREQYQVGGIADATTTVFTIDAAGVEKAVSAYALGFPAEGPDRHAYRKLVRLAELLGDFDAWLTDRAVAGPYQPVLYRAVFVEEDPEHPDLVAWPWADLSPDDLAPVPDAPAVALADLRPDQVAMVTAVPSGGATGILLAAPDGSAWRLAIRPLLPDERPLPSSAPQVKGLGV